MTVARALTDTFSGIQPAHAPGFIAAQFAGAVAATALLAWLLAPPRTSRPAADQRNSASMR